MTVRWVGWGTGPLVSSSLVQAVRVPSTNRRNSSFFIAVMFLLLQKYEKKGKVKSEKRENFAFSRLLGFFT
jgi:hypothetical protein